MNWIILTMISIVFVGPAVALENISLGQELNHALRQSGLLKLQPFTTDGCTLSPDGDLHNDWSECCVDHDIAYWAGGSRRDRLRADEKLLTCVNEKAGLTTALLYFNGVRNGGRPFSVMPYRWGYGWNYLRTYEALSNQEKELIKGQLGGSIEEMRPQLRRTPLTALKTELTFDYCDQMIVKMGLLDNLQGEVKNIDTSVDSSLSIVTKKYVISGEKDPRIVHFPHSIKMIDCYNP